MTKNNYIITSLLLIGMLGLFSCKKQATTAEAEEKEEEVLPEDIVEMRQDQIQLAGIETGKISLRTMSGILKVNGTVTATPQNTAAVSMPLGGFIKSTRLMPGSRVTKGQTLAVIENPEFIDLQQDYLEAKTKLEYTEADYRRQKELYKNEVSSAKNMQQATADYRNLKIQVKALEQKLELIGINASRLTIDNISRSVNLPSPISGYVKTVNISMGKAVSPTDILVEIINENNLIIQLTLFEKDVNKVRNHQKIHFVVNNESEEHTAIVYQTAQSVDTDKSYKVYAGIQGSCQRIVPGMYVNARIECSTANVTAVPNEAIVSFDNKDYIFVQEKNKVEDGKNFIEYKMIPVRKGLSDGDFTEVVLPATVDYAKTKLVVKGAYNLLSAKKNAGEMAC